MSDLSPSSSVLGDSWIQIDIGPDWKVVILSNVTGIYFFQIIHSSIEGNMVYPRSGGSVSVGVELIGIALRFGNLEIGSRNEAVCFLVWSVHVSG